MVKPKVQKEPVSLLDQVINSSTKTTLVVDPEVWTKTANEFVHASNIASRMRIPLTEFVQPSKSASPSEKFSVFRGVFPSSQALQKRLTDLFSEKPIKDSFDILVGRDRDQPASQYAFSFKLPGQKLTSTVPVHEKTFLNMAAILVERCCRVDKAGKMSDMDLLPYIVVRFKLNSRYVANASTAKSCKKCGEAFQPDRRHKCRKSSTSSESQPKSLLRNGLAKAVLQGSVAAESAGSVQSLVSDDDSSDSTDEKSVIADQVSASAVSKGQREANVLMEKLVSDHAGQGGAYAEAKPGPGGLPGDDGKNSLPSVPVELSYVRDVARRFPFTTPRTIPQVVELLPWDMFSLILKGLGLAVFLFLLNFFWHPISKFLFYREPENIFDRTYCRWFSCEHHTYLEYFIMLYMWLFWLMILLKVASSMWRFASTCGTRDVVLSASLKPIRKISSNYTVDMRPNAIKNGVVTVNDPNVWEVELKTRIFCPSTTEPGDTSGFFTTVRTRTLFVSFAAIEELASNRTFNETADLATVKRNLSNAVSNLTVVNIPKQMITQGVSVMNDTNVYALHYLQSLRGHQDLFAQAPL